MKYFKKIIASLMTTSFFWPWQLMSQNQELATDNTAAQDSSFLDQNLVFDTVVTHNSSGNNTTVIIIVAVLVVVAAAAFFLIRRKKK